MEIFDSIIFNQDKWRYLMMEGLVHGNRNVGVKTQEGTIRLEWEGLG